MKYFSTFSGIGGFDIPLVGKGFECVGFSEIDRYAISVYEKHFPTHKNFGDISQINMNTLPDFDLLVGGSPCQDLSVAKQNRQGLAGARSGLFYKYVEILEKKKPKYFILENVASMPREAKEEISRVLGVEPVMINAALVSAQNRKRLFWTNFPITQPDDKGIFLKDILEEGLAGQKSYALPATYYKENVKSLVSRNKKGLIVRIGEIGKGGQGDRIYSTEGKSVNLSANGGGRGAKTGLYAISYSRKNIGEKIEKAHTINSSDWRELNRNQAQTGITDGDIVRKLTPIECARLQCFPDDWCEGLSNTRQYMAYGNAVNVEVIRHIVKNL